jgi:hypothetical protein
MELGLPGPTAEEVATQIAAQTGDADRLIGAAIVPPLARELAAQIDAAGTISAPRLAAESMATELAREVAVQIAADRA